MSAHIIRFSDFDRRSKNPDAVSPRNPVDADVIQIEPWREKVESALAAIVEAYRRLDESVPRKT